MTGYSFAKKEDAVGLLELLSKSRQPRLRRELAVAGFPVDILPEQRTTDGFIFFTPSAGIPGRSGNTPGLAECTMWCINPNSGELEEITGDDGESKTYEVYHIGTSPVSGNAFIQAKRIFGVLVADMEDCA